MSDQNAQPRMQRVLLKLSGEALMGSGAYGVDQPTALRFAREIHLAAQTGAQICVVVGGGNIFRGLSASASGMDRVKADYIGMLATLMNAIAITNALTQVGAKALIHSAIPADAVGKRFNRDEALADLASGHIVVFAGGTGNPFFTTDTTAALRAAEMQCDMILKATQVDGIYSADPKLDPNAQRYDRLTYDEALKRNLKVMDGAAFALARDAQIPIAVFRLDEDGSIARMIRGEQTATIVSA